MTYEGFQLFEKRKRGAYLIRQNGVVDCFFKQPEDGICKNLRMQSIVEKLKIPSNTVQSL